MIQTQTKRTGLASGRGVRVIAGLALALLTGCGDGSHGAADASGEVEPGAPDAADVATPEDGADGDGGGDVASSDGDYEVVVLEPPGDCDTADPRGLECQATEEHRRLFVVDFEYVGDFAAADAVTVRIGYHFGPKHVADFPTGYEVLVEDGDGGEVLGYTRGHPALLCPEGADCFCDETAEGFAERFDVTSAAVPGELRVTDRVARCGPGAGGVVLARVDLGPAIARFCDEVATSTDPWCSGQ